MSDSPWWQRATFYHVYVRSFFDSDDDGFGDIRGVTAKLDYLRDLGVDAIWLSPIMQSPNHDWGYDVSDYCDVAPDLGSLDDVDELIAKALGVGIKVLLDLVPNHTSNQHAWFREALQSRDSRFRDYYVWADPGPDGSLPNNWLDATGQPAWEWDAGTGQYYLHNFAPQQPDLNWRNPAVWDEFDSIMDFWYDRGVAGFRIDVANGLFKDVSLRDNPWYEAVDVPDLDVPNKFGQEPRYNFNQPEVHDVFRHWRQRAELRSDVPLLLGETWVEDIEDLARYYGKGDELQLAFNFPLLFSRFGARRFAATVRRSLEAFPPRSVPMWAASNHDLPRMATRWAREDSRRIRLIHTVLALLPGAYNIYYGDELGMPDSDIPPRQQLDPLTAEELNDEWPRDNARSPMRWDVSEAGGFSQGKPWLPLHPDVELNVEAQSEQPDSTLNFVKALLAFRRRGLGAQVDGFEEVELSDEHWTFTTGSLRVHANFSPEDRRTTVVGDPVISSAGLDRPNDRGKSGWTQTLAPWEVLVTRVPAASRTVEPKE